MVKFSVLFISVLTLFCYMIPGFILKKTKIADKSFTKGLSVYTLYVAQVSMLIYGFIIEFNIKTLKGIGLVFLLSLIIHIIFYIISKNLFKKAPETMKKVLRFGVMFSNAGYMGIPVINDVFGPEYTVYATVYIVVFNVFVFSLGRLIYTEDKKFISVKKIIINPAVIPIIIGLILFLTGAGGWIRNTILQPGILGQGLKIVYDIIGVLKDTVAPASMMIIGANMADIKFKGFLKDKYMYYFIFVRLFAFPAIVWALLKVLFVIGFIDQTVMSIVLILSSTPAAAVTTMFAELYNADSKYSGKLVSVTTALSTLSMPIVSLLLQI